MDGNVTKPDNHTLMEFASMYATYHGYISLCVCMFGIITNLFNIAVLTRKHMHTPTNMLLTWLAVSDVVTMMSYVPFAVHFYCQYPPSDISPEKNNKAWMTFMLFHVNLTSTTHTVSIWLCVALAIFRFLHIRTPTKGPLCRRRRLKQVTFVIIIIYLSSAILLIPNYMSNKLTGISWDESNGTVYVFQDMKLGSEDTDVTVLVNVWLYAMTAKLIPCLLMSIFGSLLIYKIHVKMRQRRKRLAISGASSLRLSEHSRTTRMLLAVIVLFLITELPQGVLIVLSAVVHRFFENIYIPLGDVMDATALINNAVNFVLYCTMSAQFRKTLINLYCKFLIPDRGAHEIIPMRETVDTVYSNNNKT